MHQEHITMTTTPPDTAAAAFVQALAPDQYATYADRTAAREAASAVTVLESPDHLPGTYQFADADGDLLIIGRAAFPAGGTPSVSIYGASGEPVHVPVEQVPEVIAALEQHAGITPAPMLSDGERSFLAYALDLADDAMASEDGFTDDDRAALASLRKLAGGES
jgi:hypothetical protein